MAERPRHTIRAPIRLGHEEESPLPRNATQEELEVQLD